MLNGEYDPSVPRQLSNLGHAIAVHSTGWSCSCGAGGAGQTEDDSVRQAQDHGKQIRFAPPYELPHGVRSAQEVYTEMVREGLRPRLRSLGFTGPGPIFTWPSDTHFAAVGLQKSTYSNRAEVQFTLNVGVVERAVWEAARAVRDYLPIKPSPNTGYSVAGDWGGPIGSFLPSRKDAWWAVSGSVDWHRVADAVAEAVASFVVPELRSRT